MGSYYAMTLFVADGLYSAFESVGADSCLLVRGGQDGVTVVEGLHDIPDKVHELIGLGLTGKAADFHDNAQVVDKHFTFYRSFSFNRYQFGTG